VQQPPLPYLPTVIYELKESTMAELLFFTNNINPANDWEARTISLQGEFYVCSACTTVMVHNWTTRDSQDQTKNGKLS